MKIELLSITNEPEKHIEKCGRTCYASEGETGAKFINHIMTNKHLSVIEHAHASFKVTGISRACSHQLVRHRHFSFSQQSQRYVDAKKVDHVIPISILKNHEALTIYIDSMIKIKEAYAKLRECEILKEDARFVLPNACTTEIIISGNFRTFFEFLEKRLDPHAQWEIRELAQKIKDILSISAPNIFK